MVNIPNVNMKRGRIEDNVLPAQVASPQSQMSSPGGPKPVKFDLSAGPPQVILPGGGK